MATARENRETVREEVYNVHLEQLLRKYGVPARAERRRQRGTPDVRVELSRQDLILLECKYASGESALLQQLGGRLESHQDALGIVGVIYPDGFRYEDDPLATLEKADNLEWWLYGSKGNGQALLRRHRGSVMDLATHVPGLPLEIEGQDRVLQATGVVRYALSQASKSVGSHARIASLVAEIIAESDRESDEKAAIEIASLVLFNAMAFQDRLAGINRAVPTLEEVIGTGVSGLRETWRMICERIDYVPVYEIAEKILAVLEKAPGAIAEDVLSNLRWAVRQTRTMEGHDLSGRLFHTLLTDAKYTGAYYTSIPAATMLAQLVFTDWPKGADWGDYTWPASLNIADLACGTGTLLMAVASEAERRHRQAGGTDTARLHKALVEMSLYGFDVQLSAIHFAATSLAMLNPSIEFDQMHLTVMPYGVDGEKINLGSLDFLIDQDSAPAQFTLSSDMATPPPPRIYVLVSVCPDRVSGGKKGSVSTCRRLTLQ